MIEGWPRPDGTSSKCAPVANALHINKLPHLNSFILCPVNAEWIDVAPLDDDVSGVLSSEMTERSSLG